MRLEKEPSRTKKRSTQARAKKPAPAQRREAGLRPQPLGVVAGGQKQLRCTSMPDRVAGHEVGREFVDDGANHRIEIRNFVV